jgi:hypothetical protein
MKIFAVSFLVIYKDHEKHGANIQKILLITKFLMLKKYKRWITFVDYPPLYM